MYVPTQKTMIALVLATLSAIDNRTRSKYTSVDRRCITKRDIPAK